jgi:hypothetical protein
MINSSRACVSLDSLDSTATSTSVLVLTNHEQKMPENATREFSAKKGKKIFPIKSWMDIHTMRYGAQ